MDLTEIRQEPIVNRKFRSQLLGWFRKGESWQAVALPLLWVLSIVIFGIVEPATFLTVRNFDSIFGYQAVPLILAVGLLIPLTTGDFDLSIAANMGFSGVLVAVLNVNHHWPIGLAIVVAVMAGLVVGVVNAFVVVRVGVNAFIVTLASATVLSGLALAISNEATIGGVSPPLITLVNKSVGGFPLSFYFGLLLAASIWYLLAMTPTGRRLFFIGRGSEVSRLSGVRVGRLRAVALVLAGLISGIAGVVNVGTLGAADPNSASLYLLPAFAAAFLGATTITPGRFNVWGTVLTIFFLDTCFTGLQLLGISNWVQEVFYGSVLIVAVAFAQGANRRRLQKRSLIAGDATPGVQPVNFVDDGRVAEA